MIENMKGVRVLVTGAGGFKGAWLARMLVELGADVVGCVRGRHDPDSSYGLLELRGMIKEAEVDLASWRDVYDLVRAVQPEVVFHLGAKAIVPAALRGPRETFETNTQGTVNVLEALRITGSCRRLLAVSTDHVFGNLTEMENPIGPDRALGFSGPYETSKVMMEMAVRSYVRNYSNAMPATAISRCGNVFGAGDSGARRLIPLWIREAHTRGTITLRFRRIGRQFLPVADAVAGYILAVSSLPGSRPAPPIPAVHHFGEERYPGTPRPWITVEALAHLLAEITGAEVREDPAIQDYHPDENPVIALDTSETRRELGWSTLEGLEDSLRELVTLERAERQERRQAMERALRLRIGRLLKPGPGGPGGMLPSCAGTLGLARIQ